jgi:hypothetical protein
MKTETVYVADDGTKFDTEAECVAYEVNTTSNRLLNLIRENIKYEYGDITYNTVKTFIESNIDEINKILGKSEPVVVEPNINEICEILGSPKEESDGWISNVGRDECSHPETLSPDTPIEVKFRDQETCTRYADSWDVSWKEADHHPKDIVAYRILKD